MARLRLLFAQHLSCGSNAGGSNRFDLVLPGVCLGTMRVSSPYGGHVPRKIRELKADLRRAGFRMRPGKGSHTSWKHPLVPGRVVIGGGDGDDAQPYQEQEVRAAVAGAREAEGGGRC